MLNYTQYIAFEVYAMKYLLAMAQKHEIHFVKKKLLFENVK